MKKKNKINHWQWSNLWCLGPKNTKKKWQKDTKCKHNNNDTNDTRITYNKILNNSTTVPKIQQKKKTKKKLQSKCLKDVQSKEKFKKCTTEHEPNN